MNRHYFALISVVMLSSILGACVGTSTNMIDPTLKLAKICPDGVKLFVSPDTVPGTYQKVAWINSESGSGFGGPGTDKIVQSEREKAAALGANGIIFYGVQEPGTTDKVMHLLNRGWSANRTSKALAVYIPADSTRVHNACKTPKG